MMIKKKKGWNRYPNTWDGRFYILEEHRKKILDLIKNKKL